MRVLCRHWPLALLLVAFVALATLYNVANPVFEAPDESWHYRFVKYLADGEGLPVLHKDPQQNVAGQEGGQPPLYYVLGALATFWIDTGDLEDRTVASPYLQGIGKGPNLFVHTAGEDFPYQNTSLAVHVVRGLSTIIGAVTVLLIYLLGLEVLKRNRSLALVAAAFVAFIPQFLFLSASINNDNLITLLSALVLLISLRILNRGLTFPVALLLGAALAASTLSKVSGLALLPLAAVALGLRARQEGSLASLRACLVLPPAVALGAGWWYARNWGLYGDPLGLGFFLTAAGAAKPTLGLGQLLGEAERIWVTLWAMFGWSNVPADPAFYALYGFLILLGGLGLVRLAARKEKHPVALSAPITAVLLLWIATYTALVLQYMRMISGMQGRLLFPALPALAILLATGLATIIPRQWTKRLPAVLGATLFVPALLAPFLYILPAYPRVGLLGQSQVGAIPRQLDVNYGNLVKLLGYRMEDSSLKPGQPLTITLYWQALAAPRKNYTLFLHAFDAWGNTLGQMDVLLGERGYPTAAWRTGDALEETYTLTLEEPKERPSLVRFEAGLYLFPSMERLQALDPQGRPLGTSVPVIKAKAAAPPPQPPLPGRDVSLGNRVHLTGYQGPNTALKGGQTLEGRIWWKALDGPGRDYTVFVQLLGPGGLLAQYDAQPRANSYPTSLWEAGEVVEDFFRLSIPRQAPPGVYRLIAGMYDSSSGERLRSNGDDYILLQEIPLEADLPSK